MLLQSMAVAAATRAAERWVFLVRLNRKKSRAQPLALHVLHSYICGACVCAVREASGSH